MPSRKECPGRQQALEGATRFPVVRVRVQDSLRAGRSELEWYPMVWATVPPQAHGRVVRRFDVEDLIGRGRVRAERGDGVGHRRDVGEAPRNGSRRRNRKGFAAGGHSA